MINNDLLTKPDQATINEGIFMDMKYVCGRVKLWSQVLREETVRTLHCGGRR